MADLKVKLQFNDEDATSFEYDKLNGLKSFSFLNESKTDDESIDYSVKSNTGSLSAVDIAKSKGYTSEFLESLSVIDVEKTTSSLNKFRGICYSEEDDTFYITNFGTTSYPIYKTNDFSKFSVVQLPYENFRSIYVDGIIKFKNHIVCTGWIYYNNAYVLGYMYYDGTTINYSIVGTKTFTSQPPLGGYVTRCLKIVDGKLFIAMGHYSYDMVNFYIDDLGGEVHTVSIPFSYTATYKYFLDVLYSDNKYIFLSNYGVFETEDLSNFKSLYSLTAGLYVNKGSLIKHNGYYYFTNWERGIYKTLDFKNFSFVKMSIPSGIINIKKIDDVFLLISGSKVYYSNDLVSVKEINTGTFYEFSGIAVSPKYIAISTASSNFSDSYILHSQEKLKKLVMYNSLYDYLITKPKYNRITVDCTLDGKTLGSFINSGKIGYNNDARMIDLNFQNNIVLLQNKKYKLQIDKSKIDSTNLFEMLSELVSVAGGLIGQEFEINSDTQTYLESVNVQYPYLEEASVWEQLNKICVVGQLVIYPSGTKIKVERWV